MREHAGVIEANGRISPWHVLLLALGAQVGISVIDQGIPTLAGFLKRDLELSAGGAGLLVSAYAFGKIVGSYAAGVAADRLGERRVLVLGGAGAATLVALAATAAPIGLLFLLLLMAGIAGAAGTPAGGRLVLLAFPAERRGLALGIRQTGIPLGGLVAAAVLSSIAVAAGWRWSFVAAAALAILGLLPLALTRIERAAEPLLKNVQRPSGQQRNVYLLTVWACLIVSGQYALLVFLALDLHETASLSLAAGSLLPLLAGMAGIAGLGLIGYQGAVGDDGRGGGGASTGRRGDGLLDHVRHDLDRLQPAALRARGRFDRELSRDLGDARGRRRARLHPRRARARVASRSFDVDLIGQLSNLPEALRRLLEGAA